MDYEKQTFVDGEVLTAAQLNHMENGIEEAMNAAKTFVGGSNPNLLDNWYFVDPINQRGQTTYSGNVISVDRWKINGNSPVLEVVDSGAKLSTTGRIYLTQVTECVLTGKTITLSLLTTDGLISGTVEQVAESGSIWIDPSEYTGLYYAISAISGGVQFGYVSDREVTLIAAKMELGSQQTLARQENGVWVLNDPPPNKALELAKCQRYFVRLGDGFYTGFSNSAGAIISFAVQLPVTMRSTPVISNAVFANVRGLGQAYSLPSSYTTSIFSGSAILLDANMSTAVSASNLFTSRITQIDISADL